WGVRTPWKIDLDPGSDTLWVGDVGARSFEEISVATGVDGRPPGWGNDFGWSRFEGFEERNPDLAPAGGTTIDPVLVYAHDGVRCAVSGGVVYRGEAIPELTSAFVFGDFCEGSVWAYDATDGEAVQLGAGIAGISGVRRGPDGELYVLSWFGEIWRIEPA
ncbi:MAG: PQQ-dependent sugar dehydrogenase, partial [Acidimicrobiia bacterium]